MTTDPTDPPPPGAATYWRGINLPGLVAAGAGSFVTVHPDDYRPSDPDNPDSPHLWQAGDRVTVTPFTVGERQPVHEEEGDGVWEDIVVREVPL